MKYVLVKFEDKFGYEIMSISSSYEELSQKRDEENFNIKIKNILILIGKTFGLKKEKDKSYCIVFEYDKLPFYIKDDIRKYFVC